MLATNVGASAVARFRSHLLSPTPDLPAGRRGTKITLINGHVTALLQRHFVGGSFWPYSNFFVNRFGGNKTIPAIGTPIKFIRYPKNINTAAPVTHFGSFGPKL